MKRINLTQGKTTVIDNKNFAWLSRFKWYAQKDLYTYYAVRSETINGKNLRIKMHRQIKGIEDSRIKVDHKDRDGLNNREKNLRIASQSENCRNRKTPKT